MKKPFTVYLDSNVLIRVCDGGDEDLRKRIDLSLTEGELIYPFSAEQLDELTSSKSSQQDKDRLDYLGHVSKNIYFCNTVTELGFVTQAPQEVYDTINEVVLLSEAKYALNNFVTHEQRIQARSALGLSPNVLNNMSGKEAAAAIDLAMSKLAPPNQPVPRSLRELMVLCERFVPTAPTVFGEPSRSKTQYEKRNQEIVTLFSFLDSFGYWPDNERAVKRGSGFSDARHVVNASFYHALVSADKKLRGKAEAVYQILGLRTYVLSIEEFMRLEVAHGG